MARLGAGVRKRKNGTLEKRFTIKGVRYSVYGLNNKELTEKEQAIRKELDAGLYKKNRSITLNEYFNEVLERKKVDTKGNSLYTYRIIYNNHIMKRLGACKVCNIERRQIIDMQQTLMQELSPSTINYIMVILNIVFNEALKDEIISKNPASKIKSIKQTEKATDTIHRALTEQEQVLFMQEAKDSYYYELFALLLCTGMRLGEACALTWGDIDYNENVIHINKTQTFSIDGKLTKGTPKSEAGNRDIPLTETTKAVLKAQREKLGNLYKIDMKNDNIFISLYGKKIRNGVVNIEIQRILSRLEKKGQGIEYFTSHAFRDTFATRYIEQGGQPQTLKTILGHSSLAMTMDLYAHVLPNTKQEEMNRINIAL